MFSLNGVGTTLYGKTKINKEDGSYTATKWFVLLYLPIIPLGSYRVIKGEKQYKSNGSETQYSMRIIKLDVAQVIRTYCFAYGSIIGLFLITYYFHQPYILIAGIILLLVLV